MYANTMTMNTAFLSLWLAELTETLQVGQENIPAVSSMLGNVQVISLSPSAQLVLLGHRVISGVSSCLCYRLYRSVLVKRHLCC